MSGIAITFPSSPSEGELYLAQNGFTYIYDSQKNRWKRGGDFVRSPKVLSFAGEVPDVNYQILSAFPAGEVGIDSFKAYRDPSSYPDHTEIQISTSSNFSSVAYAATFSGIAHTVPYGILDGDTTYYLRARQFVGNDPDSADVGAISGYTQNPVRFITTSITIDSPTIVSIAGTTGIPVYTVGYGNTTLPLSVEYSGSGVENLDKVEYEITGPLVPISAGDTALPEVGVGTLTASQLASSLVFAMPLSGEVGASATDEVNTTIRSASGVGGGTTKTITNTGVAFADSPSTLENSSYYYSKQAVFSNDNLTAPNNSDFQFGAGDFTIECWVYITSASNDVVIKCADNNAYTNGWSASIDGLGSVTKPIMKWISNGTTYESKYILPLTKWVHLSWVRRSGVINFYADGVLNASFAIVDNYNPTGELVIGSNGNADYFSGRIRDIRVYKGIAKYTEEFAPPLPIYGNISYTTGIVDVGFSTTTFYKSTGVGATADVSSTAANALILAMPMNSTFQFQDINDSIRTATPGAVSGIIKTTTPSSTIKIRESNKSRWYDSLGYFNGSSDYVEVEGSSNTALGGGDFTIEGWFYSNNNDVSYRTILSQYLNPNYSNFRIRLLGTSLYFLSSNNGTSWNVNLEIGSIPSKTWVHFAVVYTDVANILSTYVNGIRTQLITPSSVPSLTSTGDIYVGSVDASNDFFDGYIQDIKIYKGYTINNISEALNFPYSPMCGNVSDISVQTGFTTETSTGEFLSDIVGLGSTASVSFDAVQTLSTSDKIVFSPGSKYQLKVRNTSGLTTSNYSNSSNQFGIKSVDGIYDPYGDNLVLAIPGGAYSGLTTAFDVTGQIKLETPTSTYSSGQVVTSPNGTTHTNKGITLVGNVTDSATQSKYYGRSLVFDGVGDYLVVGASSDTTFGTGDFTIEGWFRTSTTNGTAGAITNYYTGSYFGNFLFYRNVGNMLFYSSTDGSTWNHISALNMGTISVDTWTHLAVVRKNGVVSTFNNGIYITNTTGNGNLISTELTRIGVISTQYWNGYMQDIRIYKGVAKYNQNKNFIPPNQIYI